MHASLQFLSLVVDWLSTAITTTVTGQETTCTEDQLRQQFMSWMGTCSSQLRGRNVSFRSLKCRSRATFTGFRGSWWNLHSGVPDVPHGSLRQTLCAGGQCGCEGDSSILGSAGIQEVWDKASTLSGPSRKAQWLRGSETLPYTFALCALVLTLSCASGTSRSTWTKWCCQRRINSCHQLRLLHNQELSWWFCWRLCPSFTLDGHGGLTDWSRRMCTSSKQRTNQAGNKWGHGFHTRARLSLCLLPHSEPAVRKILRALLNARHALGLPTKITTAKP